MAKTLIKFLLFLFLLAPLNVLASVSVTEVMYDAPGSDSGHEWIEISTDAPVDLHGYKFFEAGVNHGLTVTQGTSSLAAGEVAIISNNPQTFLADFPNYSGSVFKSSFSLSNTGENVSLKDSKLQELATLSYSAAAEGDGNSLHLKSGEWVPGAPNPGSLAVTAAIVKPVVVKTPVVKKSSAKATSKTLAAVNSDSNASQSAAVTNFDQSGSSLPQNNLLWTGLGLAALIVLGVGGALYARNASVKLANINEELTAEEFEIMA